MVFSRLLIRFWDRIFKTEILCLIYNPSFWSHSKIGLKEGQICIYSIYIYTHTHTHTHIYIHIYIYRERERERERERKSPNLYITYKSQHTARISRSRENRFTNKYLKVSFTFDFHLPTNIGTSNTSLDLFDPFRLDDVTTGSQNFKILR